jgi:nucleoside-triphosphatase
VVTPPRILLTGPPGSGKTTVVRKVVELLSGVRMAGFYTEEIRTDVSRTGFRVITLDGRSARLASVGSHGGPRVGRYTVHVTEFEAVALAELEPLPDTELLVLDEIGKMECFSPAFVRAARRALAAPVAFLGTVALVGGGFIADAKRSPGVTVIAVSAENREGLSGQVAAWLRGKSLRGNR